MGTGVGGREGTEGSRWCCTFLINLPPPWQSGLEEMRSGRPLTAGGSAREAPRPFLSRPSSARPSTSLGWRPSSAALLRPGTALSSAAASGRPVSARPGTAAVHSGNGAPGVRGRATSRGWMERAGISLEAGSSQQGRHRTAGPETLLMSMPALTFPLAASMSKLSRWVGGRWGVGPGVVLQLQWPPALCGGMDCFGGT